MRERTMTRTEVELAYTKHELIDGVRGIGKIERCGKAFIVTDGIPDGWQTYTQGGYTWAENSDGTLETYTQDTYGLIGDPEYINVIVSDENFGETYANDPKRTNTLHLNDKVDQFLEMTYKRTKKHGKYAIISCDEFITILWYKDMESALNDTKENNFNVINILGKTAIRNLYGSLVQESALRHKNDISLSPKIYL